LYDSSNKLKLRYYDGTWHDRIIPNTFDGTSTYDVAFLANGRPVIGMYDMTHQTIVSGEYLTGSWVWTDYTIASSVVPEDTGYVSIAMRSDDTAVIVYNAIDGSGNDRLRYAVEDASGNWTLMGIIDSVGSNGRFNSVTTDEADAIHISYACNYALCYLTDKTGAWVSTIIDDTSVFQGSNTRIHVDSEGYVHIAYALSGSLRYATTRP